MKALILNCTLKPSSETSSTGAGLCRDRSGYDYSDRVARNAARNLLGLVKVLKPDVYPVPESGEQD